jgi:tryptophan 2,3-dioxygenase
MMSGVTHPAGDDMAFGLRSDEGEPRLSYGSYLRVADLLGLQVLESKPPQHDEMLFIIVHQVHELWFRQLLHELDAVMASMDADDALGARRLLDRCTEIERVLIAQVKVLETMTPNDFLEFRDHLMPASGFQSVQFRCIEFVCGLKDPRHLAHHADGSIENEMLEARLAGPTVGERFYAQLRRRGFVLPEGEEGGAHEARVHELTRLYHEPRSHYDLHLLAEALIEFDQRFALWRLHHVEMVERMIGAKPGTGGSEGVSYLRGTLRTKFFPELWELRSHLSRRSG